VFETRQEQRFIFSKSSVRTVGPPDLLGHEAERTHFDLDACGSSRCGQDLLLVEVSTLHSDTPQSVGLLCTSDRPVADRGQLKCDGTRVETRFRLSAKRTSPFKSAGASVQWITGSRGVSISGSNAGYTMFRGSVKGIGYPLHSPVSPSLPLPCVTVCRHVSTGAYLYLTTQNSQETDIHAPGGIRTRSPSQRAAADHSLERAATGIAGVVYTSYIYPTKTCVLVTKMQATCFGPYVVFLRLYTIV